MNQPDASSETVPAASQLPVAEAGPLAAVPAKTPLALALAEEGVELAVYCGSMTPRLFRSAPAEIDALLHGTAVSDLGWRAKILVTGEDRVRWMNGMVSNTVQGLPEAQGNYNFLLSVQGRIQGDAWVYRREADLMLDTSRDQLSTLLAHLNHFIIMDDVELADVSPQWTALSLAGPRAHQVLATLGISLPASTVPLARLLPVHIGEVACFLIQLPQIAVPRFEVWFPPEQTAALWETLLAAGAEPCGLEATEALRVLEATPLYGVDLNDRDLPQETAQTRALNFSKGCYLGQEIVERIRSRGKVNRQLRQFSLQGPLPSSLPVELLSAGQPVGRITTAAVLPGAGLVGLGFIRLEVAERQADIHYNGGAATILATPPAIART